MKECNHLFVSCKLEDNRVLYECLNCRERNYDIDRYTDIEFVTIDKGFKIENYEKSEVYFLGDNFKFQDFDDLVIGMCDRGLSTLEEIKVYLENVNKNRSR